ncbi:MAG TPA: ABC transporter substrate-binding protein [Thermoanaerobaculia bacterium]|nr:ABC transporter substrate-binding protein [Thermoanaerobaculia bacterium]
MRFHPSLRSRLGAVAAAVAVVWGCQAADAPEPMRQRPPDVAVVGTPTEFEGVNELVVAGSDFNAAIVHQLFVTLLEERPDFEEGPPTFAPYFAHSWEFSEDRTILTFRLRDDLAWSDGEPVTADDVRFSWEAQTSPEVRWSYAFAKENISDVEVVDPHTVRFHFRRVYATQLLDANEGVILPRHAWSKLPFAEWRLQPQWFGEHLVTAGPFQLGRWRPQQSLELRRNPTFFLTGRPRLEQVIFRSIRESSGLLARLLAGEIDFTPQVRPADAQRVLREAELRLLEYPGRQYTCISWNLRHPDGLFAEPEVRRALAHAIDRQAIVDTLWFGYARVASSPILSSVWAHNPRVRPWPYDPARARQLLERHGWADRNGDGIREKNGVDFRFQLTTNPGNPQRWDAMQMIQTQLRAVGIEVQPEAVELQRLTAMNVAGEYDATVTAFAIDTSLDLTYAFHTSAIEGGYNYGGYSSAEADALIDEFNAAVDQREALPVLQRLQDVIHRDQPFLFLWEPYRLVGHRANLQGVHSNALSEYYHLREWHQSDDPAVPPNGLEAETGERPAASPPTAPPA